MAVVGTGVPQGSVLGLFFSLDSLGALKSSHASSCHSYADKNQAIISVSQSYYLYLVPVYYCNYADIWLYVNLSPKADSQQDQAAAFLEMHSHALIVPSLSRAS